MSLGKHMADHAKLRVLTANNTGFLGTYTWATRPSAATAGAGAEIRVSDVGPQYNRFVSDGTYWRPVGMVPLLTQLTEVTKTDADTATQTVFSYTVPAGLLTPGCALFGRFEFSANAVVAVAKNLAITLGGNGIGTYQMSTTAMDYRGDFMIMAKDMASVKSYWPGNASLFGNAGGGAAYTQTARDLTTALTLTATMAWATAGTGANTLTFRPFKLWLIP